MQTPDSSKQQTLLRNRKAARRYRQNRKLKMAEMLEQLVQLEQEKQSLLTERNQLLQLVSQLQVNVPHDNLYDVAQFFT